MSQDIDVKETETLEDTSKTTSETTESQEQPKTDGTDEFSQLSEEELRDKARKWKQTATNYKQEIETKGLRNKERKLEQTNDGGNDIRKNDYMSKRQDVLFDYQDQFDQLDDSSWDKIKTLITPTLETVYEKASKEGRNVARGELDTALRSLVNFAKGESDRAKQIEDARIEGIREREKMEDAEIGGLTSQTQSVSSDISPEAKQLAEQKGWTQEEAQAIVDKRKERAKDYAVQNRF